MNELRCGPGFRYRLVCKSPCLDVGPWLSWFDRRGPSAPVLTHRFHPASRPISNGRAVARLATSVAARRLGRTSFRTAAALTPPLARGGDGNRWPSLRPVAPLLMAITAPAGVASDRWPAALRGGKTRPAFPRMAVPLKSAPADLERGKWGMGMGGAITRRHSRHQSQTEARCLLAPQPLGFHVGATAGCGPISANDQSS